MEENILARMEAMFEVRIKDIYDRMEKTGSVDKESTASNEQGRPNHQRTKQRQGLCI